MIIGIVDQRSMITNININTYSTATHMYLGILYLSKKSTAGSSVAEKNNEIKKSINKDDIWYAK